MKKEKMYNIFLFLSTFTRGLVEVFSLVLLYKKGYSLNNLLFFLFLMYMVGIVVNYVSLKINYKVVLVISAIVYGESFIYLSLMNSSIISLIILAILLACGNYSYHVIRHFLAMKMIDTKKRKSINIISINYLGIICASLIGMYLIDRLNLIVMGIIIFGLSFIAIFPILKSDMVVMDNGNNREKIIIPKRVVIFNILEQFKVIFLELQPLFLYIYVDKSIYYVGIFSIITNMASLLVIYFIAKKLDKVYFRYYALLLGLVFILKLNIKSGILLLVIAFLEGIFVKIYENFSLESLYNCDSNYISKYLLYKELIFFISKSLIMLLFIILRFNIFIIMYICIIGIVVSGFFIGDKKKNSG